MKVGTKFEVLRTTAAYSASSSAAARHSGVASAIAVNFAKRLYTRGTLSATADDASPPLLPAALAQAAAADDSTACTEQLACKHALARRRPCQTRKAVPDQLQSFKQTLLLPRALCGVQ